MAPVAGRIAYTNYDELVFAGRFLQGFLSPGIPVHRIMGMLKEVGAGLVYQGIGMRVVVHGIFVLRAAGCAKKDR
jgi:hypothetical protein